MDRKSSFPRIQEVCMRLFGRRSHRRLGSPAWSAAPLTSSWVTYNSAPTVAKWSLQQEALKTENVVFCHRIMRSRIPLPLVTLRLYGEAKHICTQVGAH